MRFFYLVKVESNFLALHGLTPFHSAISEPYLVFWFSPLTFLHAEVVLKISHAVNVTIHTELDTNDNRTDENLT